MSELYLSYLEQFAKIRDGDLVLTPAEREKYDMRLGVVGQGPAGGGNASCPYYYRYDIDAGEWYENAHRVPVHWHRQWLSVPALGGLWLKAFGAVDQAKNEVVRTARQAALEV